MKRKIEEYRKDPDKFFKEGLGEELSKWQKELVPKFLKLPTRKPILMMETPAWLLRRETPAWFKKLQEICAEEGIYQLEGKQGFHSEPILEIIDESTFPHEKEVKKK